MESDHAAMRRSPRQERGRQRVALLLDAAEELFGEAGYEAVTTNQIAARAGVPIGSLYQFFANKEAIVGAVAERYQAGAGEALDAALGADAAALSPTELAARVLGAMVSFGVARMAFTRIVLQTGASPHMAGIAAGLMAVATNRLEATLAQRKPSLPPPQRHLAARVAMTAVMALLAVATAEKPRGHEHVEAIIGEAEELLAAYLAAIDRRAASAPPH